MQSKARRVTRTDRKGRIEVLVDRFEGKRFNAPNDIVVRRDGHVYFTDPLYTPLDVRDLDFYGIYHVTPKGRIEAIARMQTRPNGVTLSPDGKILYVGNERKILAYDLNRNGQASNERVIIADLPGGPDGIRTDAKGNLYLTSGGIAVYSPAGQPLGRITLPDGARNLAFGDKDLRTLYMIGNSLYRVRVPIPGRYRTDRLWRAQGTAINARAHVRGRRGYRPRPPGRGGDNRMGPARTKGAREDVRVHRVP